MILAILTFFVQSNSVFYLYITLNDKKSDLDQAKNVTLYIILMQTVNTHFNRYVCFVT